MLQVWVEEATTAPSIQAKPDWGDHSFEKMVKMPQFSRIQRVGTLANCRRARSRSATIISRANRGKNGVPCTDSTPKLSPSLDSQHVR